MPNHGFERTRGSVVCRSFSAVLCERLRGRAAQPERWASQEIAVT